MTVLAQKWHKNSKFDQYLPFSGPFWTPGLPDGVHGNRPCPSISPSVSPSVRPSLNITETAHSIFLKLCMTLGVNKVKKVTQPEFLEKN